MSDKDDVLARARAVVETHTQEYLDAAVEVDAEGNLTDEGAKTAFAIFERAVKAQNMRVRADCTIGVTLDGNDLVYFAMCGARRIPLNDALELEMFKANVTLSGGRKP